MILFISQHGNAFCLFALVWVVKGFNSSELKISTCIPSIRAFGIFHSKRLSLCVTAHSAGLGLPFWSRGVNPCLIRKHAMGRSRRFVRALDAIDIRKPNCGTIRSRPAKQFKRRLSSGHFRDNGSVSGKKLYQSVPTDFVKPGVNERRSNDKEVEPHTSILRLQ